MSVTPIRRSTPPRPMIEQKASRMYAIAFDLNCEVAERLLGANWRGCYQQIGRVLNEFGFQGQQGSLYFGQPGSSPVTCVTAIQEVDRRYPWFGRAVKDLRMLRIEEENDLLPALGTRLRFDGEMERALDCIDEVVESVLEWSEPDEYHKPRLIEVATATPLPSIWVIARAYTDAEIEARGDDERYEIQEFAAKADADAALASSRADD